MDIENKIINRVKDIRFLAIIFFMLHAPFATSGGVYQWVDENGQIHFSQVKPKANPDQEVVRRHVKVQSSGISMGQDAATACKTMECRTQRMQSKHVTPKRFQQRTTDKQSNSQESTLAEIKKKQDEELIAECKRRREVYCDKSPDDIRAYERRKAEIQSQLGDMNRRHQQMHPTDKLPLNRNVEIPFDKD